MAQYPNQPPYGQPPQDQSQPPYQPQPQYGGQPQYGEQPQYGGQPQPQSPYGQSTQNNPGMAQTQFAQQYPTPVQSPYQPQPQYQQVQPMQPNPIASFTAPAQTVPFSAQAAVAVFMSYIFLVLFGATPIITFYGFGYGYGGITNFRLEGLLPLAGALVVFLVEKGNSFVRFHAAQALVLSIAWIVLEFIVGLLESVTALTTAMAYLNQFLFVAYVFLVAYTLFRAAYKSEVYKLPLVGNLAQSMAGPVVA